MRRAKHKGSLALRGTPLEAPIREQALPRLRAQGTRRASREDAAWAAARREIDDAIGGDGDIIVGPWLSELGFEVLYWIPFLSWVRDEFDVDRRRFVTVSRGGVGDLYRDIGDRYVEIFDVLSPTEFRDLSHARWAASGGQKQLEFDRFDRRVLAAAGLEATGGTRGILHPSTMYRLFSLFWAERAATDFVLKRTRPRRLTVEPDPIVTPRLPEGEYVSVKFYFRPSLPDDAPNRHAAAATVSALARRHPVVLLNTGLRFDDHEELSIAEQDGRVIPVLDGVPPGRNLGAQAAAIAGSRAFFGTYGGLSYLAPALGVPSFAFYSQPEFFARAHLDYARRVARGAGTSLTCIDLRRAHALELLDLA